MNPHANAILKFQSVAVDKSSALTIGGGLASLGADAVCNGGFWVLDIRTGQEYYSPKLITSLGFGPEDNIAPTQEFWQKHINPEDLELAKSNFSRALMVRNEDVYKQTVTYTTKSGETLRLICSGTIIWHGLEPVFMIGTHNILR